MKLMAMAVLLLFAATARADNIVAVILEPTTFPDLAGTINGQFVDASETVGATFNWNTTTQTMYDFTLFAAGPFWTGIEHLSFTQASIGDHPGILDLFSSEGDLFQLNYNIHGNFFQPALTSAPGIFKTDLFLFCSQCSENSERFAGGTAIVTATPEPCALLLLIAGFVFMFIRAAIVSDPCRA